MTHTDANLAKILELHKDVLESKIPIYELNIPEGNKNLIRIFYNGKIEGIELPKDKLINGYNRIVMIIRDLINIQMFSYPQESNQQNQDLVSEMKSQNISIKKSGQDLD